MQPEPETPIPMVDVSTLGAMASLTADLQTAVNCLDDLVAEHPEPCEPMGTSNQCSVSWLEIDDRGRCTKRIAHELLVAHGRRGQ